MEKSKLGKLNRHILLAGIGRSGTTWCQQIINYKQNHEVSFEPYLGLVSKGLVYIPYFPSDHKTTPSQKEKLSKMITIGSQSHETLVKEIRCNLMLRWLQDNTPLTHLVFIVRHPLQVACSWRKLGWGKLANGKETDIDVIMGQSQLLVDYPVIRNAFDYANLDSNLESSVFLWCVHHVVASLQVDSSKALLVHYEKLILEPESELTRLFNYLQVDFDLDKVNAELGVFSSTTMAARKSGERDASLYQGWKQELSNEEVSRCNKIIQIFGLDDVYHPDGSPTNLPFFAN